MNPQPPWIVRYISPLFLPFSSVFPSLGTNPAHHSRPGPVFDGGVGSLALPFLSAPSSMVGRESCHSWHGGDFPRDR